MEKDGKLPSLKEIVIRNGEPKSPQITPPPAPRLDTSDDLPYSPSVLALSSPTYSPNGDLYSANSSTELDPVSDTLEASSDSQELNTWKDSLEDLGPSAKATMETVRLRNMSREWEAPLMARFMDCFGNRFKAQIQDCYP